MLRVLLLGLAVAACHAQPVFSRFPPRLLYVGGPYTVTVYPQPFQGGLKAYWNGVERESTLDSSGYNVELRTEDLARPGFAEVSLAYPTGGVVVSLPVQIIYRVVPLDLAYDRVRNRVYLSTPAKTDDPRFPPSSLIALDPETGTIGPVLQMAGIGSLAMADDGSALYVAAYIEGVVRRVDPASFTVTSEFRFRPATASAPWTWLGVVPGTQETIAVSNRRESNTSQAILALFDGGRKRPVEQVTDAYATGPVFSPDGRFLLLNNRRFTIDSSGVIEPRTDTNIGDPAQIAGDRMYSTNGRILNYRTLEMTGSLGASGPVVVDPANQRILAVHEDRGDKLEYLRAFDLETQQPFGGLVLGSNNNSRGRLFRFGKDGVIFASTQGLMVFRTPLAGPAPRTAAAAVVNAASQLARSIAPGEILTVYGENLGPATPVAAALNPLTGRYETSLAGVEVWFDRAPATVLLAHQGQLNVIAPFGLKAGTSVNLQVWVAGLPSAQVPLTVAAAAPALFARDSSGRGPVVAINQDGTVNTASRAGQVVSLFGTGGGVTPGSADFGIAHTAERLAGTVRVLVDGREVVVHYAGTAPLLPHGVIQINAAIPAGLEPGMHAIRVIVNGVESPDGVTIETR